MKAKAKFLITGLSSAYIFISTIALAQESKSVSGASGSLSRGGDVPMAAFLANLATFFVYRIVPFLIALAFMVFVWGLVNFFFINHGSVEGRAKGKSLMVYGIAAIVVMVIFWGIVNLVANSTGLQKDKIDFDSLPKSVVL